MATHEELVSKAFQGRHGRAFLFTTATNVQLGPKEERILMTGLHSVADIYCSECTARLGWKYLEAFESRCARGRPQGCCLTRRRQPLPCRTPREKGAFVGTHVFTPACVVSSLLARRSAHALSVSRSQLSRLPARCSLALSAGVCSQKYKEGKFIVEKSKIVEGDAL